MAMLVENSPERVVFAGPQQGSAFITPMGDPIPPADVVAELAAISVRLKIEWIGGAWGAQYFGLKERWREGDPRWERVRVGELNESQAFDLLTMFPREVRTDDMIGWIRRRWGDRGISSDPRAEADRLVAAAQKLYAQADEAVVDRAVETGTQRILDESDHTRLVRAGVERAHPMVHGVDLAPAAPSVEREPKRLIEVAAK